MFCRFQRILFHQPAVVFQRREIVVESLGAADELDAAVDAAEEFGTVEFAVVVEAHRAHLCRG